MNISKELLFIRVAKTSVLCFIGKYDNQKYLFKKKAAETHKTALWRKMICFSDRLPMRVKRK